MKTSPLPKSQSRSLKKQMRAGGSACEKSKSLQKKPFTPLHIMTHVGFPMQSVSQNALCDDNKQNQKHTNQKQRRRVSKQKQRESKRKQLSVTNKRIKNFIGTKLQKKLEAYFLLLALARATLGAPISRSFTENRRYTVFIGKGNNSRLVKKLFYSRHWWNVTADPKAQNINLIWTQWSKKSILNQICQQPESEDRVVLNKIICQQQNKKTTVFNQYNYLLRSKERDSSKSSFVETQTDVKAYLSSIQKTRKKKFISITCNHVEGHDQITDKKNLFFALQKYCKQHNQNCFEVVPLTFHITGTQVEFAKLEQIQKQLSEQDKRIMWIAKPGEKSNRGNGIKVFKKINQIKQYLDKDSQKHPSRTYIIQKYIYPALYHRRKFDIRCFVLLVSAPEISAYFYNDGYLRTSSKQFKDKKFDDKFIHLTNDAIQKKGTDYGKFQKGNKITFEEYQNFLDLFEKKQINFKKDIFPKLKVLAAKSIAAGSSTFNQSRRSYSFELLGYDFMLDQNYKPWLIEVNTNPCLETGCPVLDHFIPSALNNALKIAVDSIFRPPKVNDWHLQEVITFPQKMMQPNKYELIFKQKKQ